MTKAKRMRNRYSLTMIAATIFLALLMGEIAMAQSKKLQPPLTKQELAACETIRKLGGSTYIEPEDAWLIVSARLDKPTITDDDLKVLEPFANRITWLTLNGSGITSKGLVHVAKLTKLDTLLLDNTQVDDEGLKHLTSLKKLRALRLDGTQVTGKTLGLLLQCPLLGDITLKDTKVGLAELRALQDHPALNRVDLFYSKEAKEDPAWEAFWLNLPTTKAYHALEEKRRRLREANKKKRAQRPYEIEVTVELVGEEDTPDEQEDD